jgi:transposase
MQSKENAPKRRTNSWTPLHDNVPAHRAVLVKNFLAKNNVTALEHPPYSPRLAPADFYLFPRLKSAVKGRCFCDATDIIKNFTKELKSLSKYAFQECFQQF